MTIDVPQREPTIEELDANTKVVVGDNEYVAAWYPQMGGYVGKCWIGTHACSGATRKRGHDGFDVYVFHDGRFPFSDEESDSWRTGTPVVLHHCDPDQFIRFGNLVKHIQGGA